MPSTQAKHQVEGGLLLNVVVAQRSAVFQLLASENKTLLIRRNAFLILDLGLHILNRIRGFDVQGDRLARQRFHENLHSSAQAKHQVEGGLLLNVVVAQRSAVFQL